MKENEKSWEESNKELPMESERLQPQEVWCALKSPVMMICPEVGTELKSSSQIEGGELDGCL